jgi:hypothetical protein
VIGSTNGSPGTALIHAPSPRQWKARAHVLEVFEEDDRRRARQLPLARARPRQRPVPEVLRVRGHVPQQRQEHEEGRRGDEEPVAEQPRAPSLPPRVGEGEREDDRHHQRDDLEGVVAVLAETEPEPRGQGAPPAADAQVLEQRAHREGGGEDRPRERQPAAGAERRPEAPGGQRRGEQRERGSAQREAHRKDRGDRGEADERRARLQEQEVHRKAEDPLQEELPVERQGRLAGVAREEDRALALVERDDVDQVLRVVAVGMGRDLGEPVEAEVDADRDHRQKRGRDPQPDGERSRGLGRARRGNPPRPRPQRDRAEEARHDGRVQGAGGGRPPADPREDQGRRRADGESNGRRGREVERLVFAGRRPPRRPGDDRPRRQARPE